MPHDLMLQHAFEAVVVVDIDHRIVDFNPAAEAMTGWPASEAIGQLANDVLVLRDNPDEAAIISPVALCLDSADPVAGQLAWVDRREGVASPVAYRCVPLRNGEVLAGVVAIFDDRSERERSQELLARADRLASMGTMAASIAHEINNPLTYVLGNVELVLSEPEGLPGDVVESLRDVMVGARAIERIVGDLKMLSAPDHTLQHPVDVKAVAQGSLRMVARQVRARGRLEASLGATLPVLADAIALGQVIINLTINAAQALPDRYDEDSVVRITTGHDGLYSIITVEDNGCGIPDDVLERIFDPFFTTKPLGEGSGLGLAVSHQIIRDFGGVLRVESRVGVGTKMVVMLPAHTEVPGDDEDQTVTWSDRSYPRRRVMVIDDDPLVRRALSSMLGRVHEVEAVNSVEAALAKIEHGLGYDAILCDLMMSPLNGLAFVDALPALAPDLVSRTAFVTGGVMSGSVRERVLRTGRPVAYKPFSVNEILTLVEGLSLS